jgi:hypothetical protein
MYLFSYLFIYVLNSTARATYSVSTAQKITIIIKHNGKTNKQTNKELFLNSNM